MADWDITWKPQVVTPYEYGTQHLTLKSAFESGKEQRRQKWSRNKHRFILSFNALPDTTINAIRVFFDARGGAYDSFNFPNFGQKISGTGLTLAENGGSVDTIADANNGFVDIGYNTNLQVCVNGSDYSGNNGHYAMSIVAAGLLTIPVGSLTDSESENASLEVYTSYVVRFNNDQFINGFMKESVGGIRTLELIEVI